MLHTQRATVVFYILLHYGAEHFYNPGSCVAGITKAAGAAAFGIKTVNEKGLVTSLLFHHFIFNGMIK